MKEIIKNNDYLFTLYIDAEGRYIMDVVVSWIGWFHKQIVLDKEQLDMFKKEGEPYLEKLSSEIHLTSIRELYARRGVKPGTPSRANDPATKDWAKKHLNFKK